MNNAKLHQILLAEVSFYFQGIIVKIPLLGTKFTAKCLSAMEQTILHMD